MAPYQYQPLNEVEREIRLLTLHPGSYNNPMVISLNTVVLKKGQIPRFEALSYAWGDASGEHTPNLTWVRSGFLTLERMIDRVDIFIVAEQPKWSSLHFTEHCSETLPITKNLFHALNYLRREDESRHFWIDAICVNQEDLDERGKQVQRMADIYRLVTSFCWMLLVCHVNAKPYITYKPHGPFNSQYSASHHPQ